MLHPIKTRWLLLLATFLLAACSAGSAGGEPAGENTTNNAEPIAESTIIPPTHPPLDPTYAAQIAEMRSPAVPDLPFPDNPDPAQCGIPTVWGEDGAAYLTGIYGGELVQPTVLLYESHLRFNIVARAPHGAAVDILLYQENPVIDYYLVKIKGAGPPNEGWVPAPFLSFEPVEG